MIGWDSGRRLRTSAIFTRNEPYAAFGQSMGYERPLYFHSFAQMEEDSDSVWTMPKPAASVHGIKACTYSLCSSLLIKGSSEGILCFLRSEVILYVLTNFGEYLRTSFC